MNCSWKQPKRCINFIRFPLTFGASWSQKDLHIYLPQMSNRTDSRSMSSDSVLVIKKIKRRNVALDFYLMSFYILFRHKINRRESTVRGGSSGDIARVNLFAKIVRSLFELSFPFSFLFLPLLTQCPLLLKKTGSFLSWYHGVYHIVSTRMFSLYSSTYRLICFFYYNLFSQITLNLLLLQFFDLWNQKLR